MGTIPYVYCYDTKTNGYVLEKIDFYPTLKTFYLVNGFMEQQDGTIWIKGGFIFCRYLEKEKKFDHIYNGYENERGISYRGIKDLCEDKEHNIWVGTGNNGIFRFCPAQEYFTNVYHTNPETGQYGDGNPLCFIEAKDGTILSGVLNDGLYRYDKNFNPLPLNINGISGNKKAPVWDMCASRDSNTIWMAAQLGFYSYDQKNRSATFYNPALFKNQIVRRIYEDKHSNLWICTQTMGVFKWDAKKGKTKFEDGLSAFTALPQNRVYDIMIDKKDLIWIATNTDGVYVIDPDTGKIVMHFFAAYLQQNKHICCIP